MKIQNTNLVKIQNKVLTLIVLTMLVTTGTVLSATGESASLDAFRSTGMFGITRSQTARLNVVRDDPFFQDDPFVRVELSFVDGEGNILSQKVYDIQAGKAAFLDLKGRDVLGQSRSRVQMRAVVRFVGTPDTKLAENCIPTLEVFDNESGETRFLLPAVQKVQKVGN